MRSPFTGSVGEVDEGTSETGGRETVGATVD
jgi:hypothetical protein